MKRRFNIRWLLYVIAPLLALLLVFSLVLEPGGRSGDGNILRLQAPSFVKVAEAEEGVTGAVMTAFPDDEIGISAYVQTPGSITLDDVKDQFRSIELETAQYLIGSVAVPSYWETDDVHVYVHVDGWVVAYYRENDPASKIVDLIGYDGITINTTKLRNVIQIVTSAAGAPLPAVNYYDFRYPNATHLTIVAEKDTSIGDSFQIELTSSYGYFERSWAVADRNGVRLPDLSLDGNKIINCNYCYGTFSAAQLLPDTLYTVRVHNNDEGDVAALVLIYAVP